MVSGGRQPLSGRRTELAVIAGAVVRAKQGLATAIALVGEPGIGKTRVATEGAAAAAEAGFATLWGRGWEAGGAPAYWPWRQLCDQLPRDSIGALWGARGDGSLDPDHARFELFDAVTRAIATRAAGGPIVCILDDLHVADVPSLELIAFATRHLRSSRVVWLLTWRDVEGGRAPVRDQLARIAREATVLALGALSDLDANALIDHAHADADAALRTRIVHATGGNPLFLLETLAAFATGRALPTDQLPLAEGIAGLVRDRIAPLSVESRALGEAASVIGRDVAATRWAVASAMPAELVQRGARELVGAGILVATGADRWRFGHDLVREAIYRSMDDPRIVHRRLADVLDREIAAGASALVGERAHHALHTGDLANIVAWTIAASEHARHQCACEEAIAILERAAPSLGAIAQRDAAFQLARGRAYLDHGEVSRATEAFSAAISLARKTDDPQMFAAAVLGLGARYVFGDLLHDLVALIDEALAILPAEYHDLRARLLARKAAALTPADDPEPVLEMARAALRLVSDSSDDATRLEVAVAVGAALTDFAPPRECAAVNETMIALARMRGERALELRGLSRLVANYFQTGELARADALLVTRDALARSLVQPRFAWMEPMFRSQRALVAGDFAVCDAGVAEAERFAAHDPNCARACAIHRAWLYLVADRVDELRAHEPTLMAAIRTMTPMMSTIMRAIIRFRTGELADAGREVDALMPVLPHGRSPPILAMLSEVFAAVGPTELAREAYELLSPHADSFAAFGVFGFTFGPPIAATLGDLAGALGDLDRARAHFESALVMTTRAGALVGRAWTTYWYGRALARAGDSDAARHLSAASRDAMQLGMHRLVERCREATGSQQLSSPPPRVAPRAPRPWTMVEQASAWRIEIGDRSILVPALRGMPLLARLAANPHVEIHSLELVSGFEPADTGDAGELLDDKARSAYRKRLAALADDLEDAELRCDVARAETIRAEHEALLKELSRAVGLGGKVRRAGAAAERARVTAHRRLREAIKKIAELDAELGAHLDTAIRTGTFCAYRP